MGAFIRFDEPDRYRAARHERNRENLFGRINIGRHHRSAASDQYASQSVSELLRPLYWCRKLGHCNTQLIMSRFGVIFCNQEATPQLLQWTCDVDCSLVSVDPLQSQSGTVSNRPELDLNSDEFSVTGVYPRSLIAVIRGTGANGLIQDNLDFPFSVGETLMVQLNAGLIVQLMFQLKEV